MSGVAQVLRGGLSDIAQAMSLGMDDATQGLKEEYRAQVRAAGLGNRLAGTWQGRTYPQARFSLEPAAFVWSKAPKIISLFATGAIIRPVNGSNFLWIPTDAVPKSNKNRRGNNARMTPEEVERHFNADLYVRKGNNGNFLAFLNLFQPRSGKGFLPADRRRGRQGSAAKPVLMFVLTRSVQGRKLLDLEGPARRWGAQVPALVRRRWPQR
ncbi:MAG: DUF6441 family protein [Allosphingosinicella sp.]|uniref:DUF6441 family protein n=1 Tax=Allosphingosinicella sp. TaxID=2823234 RepID=UPI003947C898